MSKLMGTLTRPRARCSGVLLAAWAKPGMNNPDDENHRAVRQRTRTSITDALRDAASRDCRTQPTQRNHDAFHALLRAAAERWLVRRVATADCHHTSSCRSPNRSCVIAPGSGTPPPVPICR